MKEPEGLLRLKALLKIGAMGRKGLPGGGPVAAGMFEYDIEVRLATR